MTTPNQAEEVVVQKLMKLADKYAKAMTDFTTDHAESFRQERESLVAEIREELARPTIKE